MTFDKILAKHAKVGWFIKVKNGLFLYIDEIDRDERYTTFYGESAVFEYSKHNTFKVRHNELVCIVK